MPIGTIEPIFNYQFHCNSDQRPFILGYDNEDDDASQEERQQLLLGPVQGLDQASCLFSKSGLRSGTGPIEFTGTIADLRMKHFLLQNAGGIAFEVWITPLSVDNSQMTTIAVIGNENRPRVYPYRRCAGAELLIGIRDGLLQFRFSDDDNEATCRILDLHQRPLRLNELTQIFVAIGDGGKTDIYINGQPVVQGAGSRILTNMQTWDYDSTLKLFPDGANTPENFDGSLHQVSMYNQIVSEEQVESMYNNGLAALGEDLANRDPLRLVAYSEENPARFIQGEADSFRIGGLNMSRPEDYTTMVEIVSLPQFGYLLADNGTVSTPGLRLPLTGNFRSLPLFYSTLSKDYFNVPRLTHSGRELDIHPEFFSYRLIAVPVDNESGDTLFGWSEPIRQELAIVHKNHPPSIVVPDQATLPEEQSDEIGARPTALIKRVEVKDPDKNIDRVRVDIWAEAGTLTFHEDVLELADFDSCSDRNSRIWRCFGTGVADRNMTFVAEPDDVSRLLSNLEYKGFNWDQRDNITIRIFDGIDGPCLSDQEHRTRFTATENFFSSGEHEDFTTIHEECFSVVGQIPVPRIRRPEPPSLKDGGKEYLSEIFEVDDFGGHEILFWSILGIVICCVCCALRACMRCRLARGSKVYPEEADFANQV